MAEHVTLSYLEWKDLFKTEKPFQLFLNIPWDAIDTRQTNMDFEETLCVIQDIRGREGEFNLDEHAFNCHHETSFKR